MTKDFAGLAKLYKEALANDVLPFWEKYSVDWEYGGYYTCIDRKGNVYDTDKFVWLQGRQVWTFAMLYNQWEKRESWLKIAKNGYDFLIKHGRNEEGQFYFSLDRKGLPLISPYNIFSDCFAAMAMGQYAKAQNSDQAAETARLTFQHILSRREDPKGKWEKSTGNRPLKGLSLPMILANLVLELEDILEKSTVEEVIEQSVDEILNLFYDSEDKLVYEYMTPDGAHLDTFEGRQINPGHGIEAMWFLMDIGARRDNKGLIQRAVDIMLDLIRYGWDIDHGGIFYFQDAKRAPMLQLEWDRKLWWVHLETLVALAKGYYHTRQEEVWDWYGKLHTYTWERFPDPDYGEWYGYLNREGEPFIPLKGGKWKGCFHVPRGLFQCWQTFEALSNSSDPLSSQS